MKEVLGLAPSQAKVEEAPGIIPIGGDAYMSLSATYYIQLAFSYVIPQWRDAPFPGFCTGFCCPRHLVYAGGCIRSETFTRLK